MYIFVIDLLSVPPILCYSSREILVLMLSCIHRLCESGLYAGNVC
jgi:hypothetical protein